MAELMRPVPRFTGSGIFGDDFDNLFEGFFRPITRTAGNDEREMIAPLDIVDQGGNLLVKAELPGVDKKDIQVGINEGVLTIRAERKSEKKEEDEEGQVICREHRYGSYSRSMRLNAAIDAKNVKAKYENGILELSIPKLEEPKAEQIKIEVN